MSTIDLTSHGRVNYPDPRQEIVSDAIRLAVVADDPLLEAGLIARCQDARSVVQVVDLNASPTPEVVAIVSDCVDDRVRETIRAYHARGAAVVNVVATLALADAVAGLVAGSSGFLLRQEAGPYNLCAVVICAAGGSSVIPSELRAELVTSADTNRFELAEPTASGILSKREAEVLRLAAHGNETADIARLLSYSERTVKGIIHGVTSRLELRNRTHAVAWAVRHGLI